MVKKTKKEQMEEKAKKLNPVSPSQALFGMTEDKGSESAEVKASKTEVVATIAESEEIETASNNLNVQSESKHQLLSFKKQKVEDTHTRRSFLVRNDLLKRFDNLAKDKHGFKIKFINYAIESALNELEKELEK